jgi:4-amino-4-deoxy-L-arabinose transferase-like glycosyltransferase
LLDRWCGRGADSTVIQDLVWLIGLALLLMAAGFGCAIRPTDEPRFALVAQDMLRSGDG